MIATSDDIKVAIARAYPSPTYATLFEVPNATGGRADRTCDAISMGCWPSRGLELIGFEIKVHRHDWIRELKHPEKADYFVMRCDRWYIVTCDGVIKTPDELPPNWGWLELYRYGDQRTRLKTRKIAPVNLSPLKMDRAFFASLMRSRAGVDAALLSTSLDEIDHKRREEFDANVRREVARITHKAADLQKQIDEFETASGIKISEPWKSGADIGKALKLVLDAGVDSTYHGIRSILTSLRYATAKIEHSMLDGGFLDQDQPKPDSLDGYPDA